MAEMIEILSVQLLDQHRGLATKLQRLARSLSLEFGWHYLLDLIWILQQLKQVGFPDNSSSLYIMDAGAGTGVLQWFLAECGVQVLSVDRSDRTNLPLRFRARYHARGLRSQDLGEVNPLIRQHLQPASLRTKLGLFSRDLLGLLEPRRASGSVTLYQQDLKALVDVPDNTLDAVVAVSALEHNPPEELPVVVAELLRVLKPGGVLLATLCAAHDQDWYHQPSQGWCYTEASLRSLFDLTATTPSNYDHYDEFFTALVQNTELRDHLAAFYNNSGENGMPWGKWDPQYQPVGVCKLKSQSGQ